MKAKRKELKKLSLADVGGVSSKTQVIKQAIQTKSRLNKVVTGDAAEAAKELVRLLHEEAKVI
jgi:electron transfer flavoprotein beta subunit